LHHQILTFDDPEGSKINVKILLTRKRW